MKRDNDDITFSDEEEENSPSALVKKLREKVRKLEKEKQEYLTGWQKERADIVNLKKRLEEEKKEFAKYAKEDIATEIIPVLDSFDSAFKNKEAWEKVDKNWRQGMEHIHTQLVNILQNHGISVLNPVGETFDPNRDEAIETIPVADKKQDHKIVEVISVGYQFHNKIIRAPKVKVGELTP